MESNTNQVYDAVSTIKGLSQWWTVATSGKEHLDGCIEFRFGDQFLIKMRVVEKEPGKKIKWLCLDAEPDWIGTELTFELEQDNNKTVLRFSHDKWPTHDDFFAHCNLNWAKYLISLREYVETGKGRPYFPD